MRRRWAARPRRRRGDAGATSRRGGEGGFTLVELMVACAVMIVVLGASLGLLEHLSKTDVRAEAVVTNEQSVSVALQQLSRDLRAANPLDAWSTLGAYQSELQVELGPDGSAKQIVRWVYDPVSGELLRELVASDGTVTSTDVEVRGVQPTSGAVFSYYDDQGDNLVASGTFTPADVANCAVRVEVSLTASPAPSMQPFSEVTDVELRNRLPGGMAGCP